MEEYKFMEANGSFPICNHTQCVEPNNIGYVQGIMSDGTPFEAELWRNDVGRILRTFKIKKNVEVTDNGKIII